MIKYFEYNDEEGIPTVLVMKADNTRNDAKNIQINGAYYSNSGFAVVSRSWMHKICEKGIEIDIDNYIFEHSNFKAVPTESIMIDIGTPERLQDYRRLT